VTIATECYTCYFWLPATIQEIRRTHPEFEVVINTNSILNPLDLLQNGKIDVAIIHRVVFQLLHVVR
jgi:LysR family transcriptional regulator for metE and metH